MISRYFYILARIFVVAQTALSSIVYRNVPRARCKCFFFEITYYLHGTLAQAFCQRLIKNHLTRVINLRLDRYCQWSSPGWRLMYSMYLSTNACCPSIGSLLPIPVLYAGLFTIRVNSSRSSLALSDSRNAFRPAVFVILPTSLIAG